MLDCFDLMAILGRQDDGQEACDAWHCVRELKGEEDSWGDNAAGRANERFADGAVPLIKGPRPRAMPGSASNV